MWPDVLRYAATRLATLRVLALVAAVVVVGMVLGSRTIDLRLGLTLLFALVAVWQLRLWDDLADRDFDRRHHPERVLVTTSSIALFVRLAVAMAVLAATLLIAQQNLHGALLYVALLLAFGGMYASTTLARHRLARCHLVNAKYPVLALLCVQPPLRPVWLPALVFFYAGLCLIELLDDRTLARDAGRTFALGVHACMALGAAALWIAGGSAR
jgi:hypothetical protein